MNPVGTSLSASKSTRADRWTVHTVGEIGSTNSAAAQLPAWSALRATTQTAGRGRTGRPWISDQGGLWLSAVLPCPGERQQWSILPLAAGWAVVATLREIGVPRLHLRWPNDVMAGRGKLAGLLVERYRPDTAVLGIGLNVCNHPELADPVLAGITARLADLVPGDHPLDDLTDLILGSIERAHGHIQSGNFSVIADELNARWARPLPVAVTLRGEVSAFTDRFLGVDSLGRIRLARGMGGRKVYEATEIALLRELADRV